MRYMLCRNMLGGGINEMQAVQGYVRGLMKCRLCRYMRGGGGDK